MNSIHIWTGYESNNKLVVPGDPSYFPIQNRGKLVLFDMDNKIAISRNSQSTKFFSFCDYFLMHLHTRRYSVLVVSSQYKKLYFKW